jgi:hypothetical protein
MLEPGVRHFGLRCDASLDLGQTLEAFRHRIRDFWASQNHARHIGQLAQGRDGSRGQLNVLPVDVGVGSVHSNTA